MDENQFRPPVISAPGDWATLGISNNSIIKVNHGLTSLHMRRQVDFNLCSFCSVDIYTCCKCFELLNELIS